MIMDPPQDLPGPPPQPSRMQTWGWGGAVTRSDEDRGAVESLGAVMGRVADLPTMRHPRRVGWSANVPITAPYRDPNPQRQCYHRPLAGEVRLPQATRGSTQR